MRACPVALTTASNGHHVVTDGPYRYVRHTSYSGIALVLAGIALACDDMWSLVAVAVLGGRAWPYGSAPRNGSCARRWATSTSTSRQAASV